MLLVRNTYQNWGFRKMFHFTKIEIIRFLYSLRVSMPPMHTYTCEYSRIRDIF